MTVFRNKKNSRLYLIYKVSPRMFTGSWYETMDYFTGECRKINDSTWKRSDFMPMYVR